MFQTPWYFVLVLCVSMTLGQAENVYYIRSQNYPAYTWGYDVKGEAYIMTGLGQRLFRIITPGLTEQPGTISFESYDKPGYFLRHYGSELHLEHSSQPRNSHIFAQDSTFFVRENKWFPEYAAYESVNYPGSFIRHSSSRLRIDKSDGSDLFKKDSSFILTTGSDLPQPGIVGK
ncbi:uncharacterized protein LOC106176089 [Lingula anatina]|uniref:Uncharacterized protein LOC106176089 n=1 Tax=Lingula anatina TaxID=7574 RepID=A0A1S3JTW0_LINAN|nr:uncharacterized protein LOC106176089 [Lingula anatina]XP_013413768.1 uncharacterized protein LOC106176089 [Lingula anatina]XP_013413769.1 uncharacterized protein LOC106176089 [Lingula anatina]XP_013413770.1 uncharacterized protein LOC106176089 [Lingula anatina]|eukprot:XP_013413767.1 uncharacterized protein LOC106176089 [Lingula anatina]